MMYLLLSILGSTSIYVLFKWYSLRRIRTFQAIVANYLVAATVGYAMSGGFDWRTIAEAPWLWAGVLTGLLFISLFYLMAFTSQRYGVSPTSVASKMSMLLPVAWFMLTDPDEEPTLIRVGAIVLGAAAVVLATSRERRSGPSSETPWALLVLFAGTGLLDLLLAHTEKHLLTTPEATDAFAMVPFFTAFSTGAVLLSRNVAVTRERLHAPSLLAGVALGIVNYASIYFLLKALGSGFMTRSAMLPANNMGIVAASALAGVLLFRERLSAMNLVGIALALGAIALLSHD
jgi:drug/metabolite transporter (DMT)-like permease